jgi:uncharacterized protein (DUF4415 family)
MAKLVRKTLADSPVTPARRRELAQLAERPDSEIDLSDIPELNEKFWANAVRNPFYRPLKQQLTVRLDADVVAWLRRQGKGYQTRLNSVLRDAMLAAQDSDLLKSTPGYCRRRGIGLSHPSANLLVAFRGRLNGVAASKRHLGRR